MSIRKIGPSVTSFMNTTLQTTDLNMSSRWANHSSMKMTPTCNHKFATLHEEKEYLNIGYSKAESFTKSFMVVGIITGHVTVPLFRVPSSVKINAQYYVGYVLKPLFTVHLPCMYPNEMDKTHFHHHSFFFEYSCYYFTILSQKVTVANLASTIIFKNTRLDEMYPNLNTEKKMVLFCQR